MMNRRIDNQLRFEKLWVSLFVIFEYSVFWLPRVGFLNVIRQEVKDFGEPLTHPTVYKLKRLVHVLFFFFAFAFCFACSCCRCLASHLWFWLNNPKNQVRMPLFVGEHSGGFQWDMLPYVRSSSFNQNFALWGPILVLVCVGVVIYAFRIITCWMVKASTFKWRRYFLSHAHTVLQFTISLIACVILFNFFFFFFLVEGLKPFTSRN